MPADVDRIFDELSGIHKDLREMAAVANQALHVSSTAANDARRVEKRLFGVTGDSGELGTLKGRIAGLERAEWRRTGMMAFGAAVGTSIGLITGVLAIMTYFEKLLE